MASENVELARRAIDSFNRGGIPMEDVVDDFEADWSNSIGPHNRVRMRGRTSRAEVEATGVQVWTIRNGKLASVKLYQSKAAVLKHWAFRSRTLAPTPEPARDSAMRRNAR